MTTRLIIIDDNEERVETGIVQIGDDDWPGIFIRGDNAFYYAMCIDSVIKNECNPISKAALIGLSELLKSCNLSK